MKSIEQRLKQALSQRQKQHITDVSRMPSAVLLPIYRKQGQYYILFTKRTEKVKHHKGEISFPGGAYQKGDKGLVETALRESAEEIGLVADAVEIIGELDDITTKTSSFVITPFVAFIHRPSRFELNREETEEIIEVPLSVLLDRSCLYQETQVTGNQTETLYFYHYRGRVIKGATARILHQFLGIMAQVMKDK